jgi:hypothetical protein
MKTYWEHRRQWIVDLQLAGSGFAEIGWKPQENRAV